MKKKFEIEQIGIIHSPYKTKDECPIQGQARPEGKGQIELFPEYEEGLETIETFSHRRTWGRPCKYAFRNI